MPNSFSIDELKALTAQVCAGPDAYDSFAAIPGAVDSLKENPHWCLELNYMLGLLHTGYDIPGHREVRIAKKIKGNELGWCLGASLPLLDMGTSGWSCKITQEA
jgi:guanosine-diphosphatase